MKIAILSLITMLMLLPGLSKGQQPDSGLAFAGGESLSFAVSYKAKLIRDSDVGVVTISVAEDRLGGMPTLRVDAYATVIRDFRWFYKMDDYYSSWIDPVEETPLKATANLREGSYRFSSEFIYDWDEMVTNNWWRKHSWEKGRIKTKTISLEEGTMDGVSRFYTLRSTDLSDLKPGDSRTINLLLEDTVRKINYKYFGPEIKNVPGLGKVKTLKFSCQLATQQGESFEDGMEFFLWLSDDPNRVPVYLESPIRVGSVRARLTGYKGLKYSAQSVLPVPAKKK